MIDRRVATRDVDGADPQRHPRHRVRWLFVKCRPMSDGVSTILLVCASPLSLHFAVEILQFSLDWPRIKTRLLRLPYLFSLCFLVLSDLLPHPTSLSVFRGTDSRQLPPAL